MRKSVAKALNGQTDLFVPSEEERLSTSDEIEITDEYRQIFQQLCGGARVVHVNGKAGTGKTVLIDHLRKKSGRNIVIVAPTGVAALQAQGTTIHSFFRFPPRIVTAQDIEQSCVGKKFYNLSLLIIDEISMVRPDIMDAIDMLLRKYLESSEPFGGVQLLLVGDLMQLPPVVARKEREVLSQMGYKSPYFFAAKVFETCPIVTQSLTKVYRQSDPVFIELLNKVRVAENTHEVISVLNKRCVPVEDPTQAIITLTCTNDDADYINNGNLSTIPERMITFTGEITGKFMLDEAKLPSPMNLSLKVGAQVMFTKNDADKKWVNGTLGWVVELTLDLIRVEISDIYGTRVVNVPKERWDSYGYQFNYAQNRPVAEVIGLYCQYPLMLAWAVTIHKAQGKTLEKVIIDFGAGAFAHGQVYVALSRCRALENIYLLKPIKMGDIKCDPAAKRFCAGLIKHK